MSKPVVTFSGPAKFSYSGNNEVARVYALDHPLLGQTRVFTSVVQKHNPDGSFETLNTIYRPLTEEYDNSTN